MTYTLPTHRGFRNLTGQRFGRLLVSEYAGHIKTKSVWKCLCDCGNVHVVRARNLLTGDILSCGCLLREKRGAANRTHGQSKGRMYLIWRNMLDRCRNKKTAYYERYGGRGITVCDEWSQSNSFTAFRDWALENGYRSDLTIDRYPDRNGNYEPTNCRWVTPLEQADNRDSTIHITAFGETKNLRQWSLDDRCTVSALAIKRRIKNGWDVERAITAPARRQIGVRRVP